MKNYMRIANCRLLLICVLLTVMINETLKAQVYSKKALPTGVLQSLALAGSNRAELEKVIANYSKHSTDSLKLKAAYFLIDNMKWHKSHFLEIRPDSAFLLFFHQTDSMYYAIVNGKTAAGIKEKQTKDELKKLKDFIRDTLSKVSFAEPDIVFVSDEHATDLNTINASFLTNQIENAFALRATSQYVQLLPFKDFCDYTLAYRIIDGPNFRCSGKDFNRFFSKYLGDVNTKDFTETVELYNLTVKNLRDILGKYPFDARTGFEELFFSEVQGFDCFSISQYAYAALNACGLPVDAEYNTAYQMLQSKHSMCNIDRRIGNYTSFSPESDIPVKKTTPFELPGGLGRMNLLRTHYAQQKNIPYFLKNKDEQIPYNLADPCIEDVTEKSLLTVALTVSFKEKTTNNLCYLATFNSATGIVPVTWTVIDKKKQQAVFINTIPDRLYFPIYYDRDEVKTFGQPFLLQYDSSKKEKYNIRYVDNGLPSGATADLVLTRKYPRKPNMVSVAENLVGTTVIASDSIRGQGDTLYKLAFVPEPYLQDIKLDNQRAYKFYRVQANKEHPNMNISEIEFLTDTSFGYANIYPSTTLPVFSPDKISKQVDGLVRVIEDDMDKLRKRSEYDGSMETAPGAYSSIILKLKKPQVITTIRFAPLNANNGVVPGNEYLLRYWAGGKWNDFEYPQSAEYNYIEFKGVPKGKLYWLRNLTTGKEELPFMVDEKGQQQFIYFDIK